MAVNLIKHSRPGPSLSSCVHVVVLLAGADRMVELLQVEFAVCAKVEATSRGFSIIRERGVGLHQDSDQALDTVRR